MSKKQDEPFDDVGFAKFLLDRKVVTPVDLLRCVDFRRWMVPFFGTLAANRGLMRADQVIEVVGDCERHQRHFGQVAVEKGYLTDQNVHELLDEQRRALKPLSNCLVKLGILAHVQAEDLRAEYLKHLSEKGDLVPDKL